MIKSILTIVTVLLTLLEKHLSRKEAREKYELEVFNNLKELKELTKKSLEKSKKQSNRDKNRDGFTGTE